MTAHLEGMGIKTAMDLAKADPWSLRKFSVVIEKRRVSSRHGLSGTGRARSAQTVAPAAAACSASADRAGADQGSRGHLHDARLGKAQGTEIVLQKGARRYRTRHVQPGRSEVRQGRGGDPAYTPPMTRLLTGLQWMSWRMCSSQASYSKAEVMLLTCVSRGSFPMICLPSINRQRALHW